MADWKKEAEAGEAILGSPACNSSTYNREETESMARPLTHPVTLVCLESKVLTV